MSMRRPIHTQKPGTGASGGGWVPPLSELWTQFCAELHGLRARVDAQLDGLVGVPTVYQGVRVFEPSASTVQVQVPRTVGLATVQPILQAGNTYEIPVYFPGPGVFVARSVEVALYQRYVWNDGESPVNQDMRLLAAPFATGSLGNPSVPLGYDLDIQVSRFSILDPKRIGVSREWPDQNLVKDPRPFVSFWWNLLDAKSQRYLGEDLLPDAALLPMTDMQPATFGSTISPLTTDGFPIDGGRFTLDAPWLIERDGQMRFVFAPTTSIYQLATTLPTQAQNVYVQVELHGERYETLQDAVRAGAATRPVRSEEE